MEKANCAGKSSTRTHEELKSLFCLSTLVRVRQQNLRVQPIENNANFTIAYEIVENKQTMSTQNKY